MGERRAAFEAFFGDAEPRLRRALVAAYGPERGREAAAEALSHAWQRWDEVRAMGNPVGYLFRVGQSRSRPRRQPPPSSMDRPPVTDPWVEPGLEPAMARLSEHQRVAVVLVHGFGWTHREVAALLDISPSTVQNHVDRGLAKLRSALKVVPDV